MNYIIGDLICEGNAWLEEIASALDTTVVPTDLEVNIEQWHVCINLPTPRLVSIHLYGSKLAVKSAAIGVSTQFPDWDVFRSKSCRHRAYYKGGQLVREWPDYPYLDNFPSDWV